MKKITWLLAEQKSEKMHSKKPDGLQEICGKPMVSHVHALAQATCGGEVFCVTKAEDTAHYTPIAEVLGGKALQGEQAMADLQGEEAIVLALPAVMPLLTQASCTHLLSAVEGGNYALAALGEQPGARAFCFAAKEIAPLLNAAKAQTLEGKLEEVLGNLMADEAVRANLLETQSEEETMYVDSRILLARATQAMQRGINRRHMEGGVTLINPEATYIGAEVRIGADTVIYPGCILEGETSIGEGCLLYANCRLSNAKIGDGVSIESSVILDAQVSNGTTVGPYAYLRPKSVVGEKCRIGDFVEIKNSSIGNGTKVSHLTYVGDSDLGEDINLGCGVVFVNYDGKTKNRSRVGDHAFIGCNVNLVAPVQVGEHAYIAAGSTVTSDVPEGAMLVARERETIKEDWVKRRKEAGKL